MKLSKNVNLSTTILEILGSESFIWWLWCESASGRESNVLQRYSLSHQPHGSRPFHDLTGTIPLFHCSNPEAVSGGMASWGGFCQQLFWEWPVTKELAALWMALLTPHCLWVQKVQMNLIIVVKVQMSPLVYKLLKIWKYTHRQKKIWFVGPSTFPKFWDTKAKGTTKLTLRATHYAINFLMTLCVDQQMCLKKCDLQRFCWIWCLMVSKIRCSWGAQMIWAPSEWPILDAPRSVQ